MDRDADGWILPEFWSEADAKRAVHDALDRWGPMTAFSLICRCQCLPLHQPLFTDLLERMANRSEIDCDGDVFRPVNFEKIVASV